LCVREIVSERDKIMYLWREARSTVMHKIDKIDALLGLLAARADAKNPIKILQSGFAKPLINLDSLKIGDIFEILYYDKKVEKGVAEWKGSK